MSDRPKAINPDHYNGMKIQPMVVIEACGLHNDYCTASALAYIMRGGRKGDVVDDLKKALNFLHRRIYGDWFVEPVQAVPHDVERHASWNRKK